MSIRTLPVDANLEHLKKQAKRLLKAIHDEDAATLSRIKPYFSNPSSMGLQDAQLVLARDYGYTSWRALKAHIESAGSVTEACTDQLASDFLRLVVLIYSETESADPERFHQAAMILQAHPEIADESIHVAVACGDVPRVKRYLESDAALVNRKGGHHHWEPIMYAAYSRLPGVSTLEVARLLINEGADPNAGYWWGGQYLFTALTGVFGQGEGGPVNLPEHPDFEPFARLLLEAGANASDSQAAYNRMFLDDNTCLELLLEFGLGAADKNNWLLLENDKLIPHPDSMIHYQLAYAVSRGKLERVRLLVENGADINHPEKERSLYEIAMLEGHSQVADYLLSKGAKEVSLKPIDVFMNAVLNGDTGASSEMLEGDPSLIAALISEKPHLIEKAVDLNRPAAIDLMLNLGFDVNHVSGRTALHQAAWLGRLHLIEQLVNAGADSTLRDHTYFMPPLGWALHGRQTEAIALLDSLPMDVFTAAVRGRMDALESLLDEDAALLEARFSTVRPCPEKPCDRDWMTPLAFAVVGNQLACARWLLERGATRLIDNGAGVRLNDLARDQADADMIALLNSVDG